MLSYNGSTYTNFRLLSGTIDGNAYTSVSISFLFNLTGNDEEVNIRFAGLSLFNGEVEQFFFGKPGNTYEVGYHKYAGGETTNGVATTFSAATVFRFDATIFFNPLGDDTVDLTLSDNSGASGNVIGQWNGLNLGSGFTFDRIRLIRDVALDFDIDADFDEIQLSAVPEPATGVLAAAAFACASALHRRRR